MSVDQLDLARDAYERMAWGDAFRRYSAAEAAQPLDADDLECAARAAELAGRVLESEAFWQRAVHECERTGDNEHAARCAYWLGMALVNRGDMAQAGGWFARADRLIGGRAADSPVRGYLLIPIALQALFGGDAESGRATFIEVLKIGAHFAESDLLALGRLGLGRSLLGLGNTPEGISLLDDAMVSVMAGEVSPLVAGIVYCAVIEACHSLFDLRRAREWTGALSRWCDSQPELVQFRGQCLTHRAEIMKWGGEWSRALEEVQRACDRLLEPPPQPAVADALYQKAELHRLRGEFAEAEAAFRDASQWGREPQPGLARLRLAQGRSSIAEASIRRVVTENHDHLERAALLSAFVDIMLAVDDVAAARPAAEELAGIAEAVGAPYLQATSAHAVGAVALADGDAQSAMVALRHAWTLWCELDLPYDAARARVLMALACRELGDDDTATMELDVARQAFAQLGAAPDLARLDALVQPTDAGAAGGLTGREIEVLELIASGKTNRQIAESLVISEKTVARHVSNIFTKLAVSSRSAATAYAFQHGLA
jgi:DNA-binding CsgD family transcriptional regulator/tetratricopeptide (TPR) repeat protein